MRTHLCLSIRESLLRGESWVERKEEEEGRGGRFWAREELLRSCEELGNRGAAGQGWGGREGRKQRSRQGTVHQSHQS